MFLFLREENAFRTVFACTLAKQYRKQKVFAGNYIV